MANYHEYCVRECTDPAEVGVSLGHVGHVDEETRICIALGGPRINLDLHPSCQDSNWISLTPACTKELYELLGTLKHVWAVAGALSAPACVICGRSAQVALEMTEGFPMVNYCGTHALMAAARGLRGDKGQEPE